MSVSFIIERVTGIEPVSRPWQGRIITTIRYPQSFLLNFSNCAAGGNRSRSLSLACLLMQTTLTKRPDPASRCLSAHRSGFRFPQRANKFARSLAQISCEISAAGGNRTRTVSLQLDFKSSASTSSATAAYLIFCGDDGS